MLKGSSRDSYKCAVHRLISFPKKCERKAHRVGLGPFKQVQVKVWFIIQKTMYYNKYYCMVGWCYGHKQAKLVLGSKLFIWSAEPCSYWSFMGVIREICGNLWDPAMERLWRYHNIALFIRTTQPNPTKQYLLTQWNIYWPNHWHELMAGLLALNQ